MRLQNFFTLFINQGTPQHQAHPPRGGYFWFADGKGKETGETREREKVRKISWKKKSTNSLEKSGKEEDTCVGRWISWWAIWEPRWGENPPEKGKRCPWKCSSLKPLVAPQGQRSLSKPTSRLVKKSKGCLWASSWLVSGTSPDKGLVPCSALYHHEVRAEQEC